MTTDPNITSLTTWMVNSFNAANTREGYSIDLLPDLPTGVAYNGVVNAHNTKLQRTYWLIDNCEYGEGALLQVSPTIGNRLKTSWRAKLSSYFGNTLPETNSGTVIGKKAAYDGGSGFAQWQSSGGPTYFDMYKKLTQTTYPPNIDVVSAPIVGIDYPASGDFSTFGAPLTYTLVSFGSARDWFKYGCLRQAVLGNLGTSTDAAAAPTAWGMLKQGLLYWDGTGIATSTAGTYYSRDLAFALMCAKACGMPWTTDPLPTIRYILSEMQDITGSPKGFQNGDGGIWTNYTYNQVVQNSAKKTNEIAPLVALAYGTNIWHP